jgi:uncharacterized PurR-regulated membrane protein YhhQ (DUF165 family)
MIRAKALATTAFGAYVGVIVLANWLTNRYAMIWVAPGLMATAGTYAAGLALGARDVLQDQAGRRAVLAAIALGAALSWLLSTPQLAVASGVAFALAELCDMAVYTPLRRHGWARAVLASNMAGAVIDTLTFLALVGFPVTVRSVTGQLVGKILWATLMPVLIASTIRGGRRRAVLREPVYEAGA